MTIQHVAIPDGERHEPKGISTATAGEVYVADGAASGSWEPVSVPSTGLRKGLVLTSDGTDGSGFEEVVWKDLLGEIHLRGVANDPSFSAYKTNVFSYSFTVGEIAYLAFHIPHDYAMGTDVFMHIHWGHNATAVAGDMVWTYHVSYSKGHNQSIFPDPVTGTISYSTVDIATTPRYIHRVDEIQLSSLTPSSAQINTAALEPDGIILVQLTASALPSTLTGASPANSIFAFCVDLHYQATGIGTLNKSPDFFA